jgi:hypothetical protein
MTAEEFGLWKSEYALRPWGEVRADAVGGIIASTVANVSRNSDTAPYLPADFMPKYGKKIEVAAPSDEAETNFFNKF